MIFPYPALIAESFNTPPLTTGALPHVGKHLRKALRAIRAVLTDTLHYLAIVLQPIA